MAPRKMAVIFASNDMKRKRHSASLPPLRLCCNMERLVSLTAAKHRQTHVYTELQRSTNSYQAHEGNKPPPQLQLESFININYQIPMTQKQLCLQKSATSQMYISQRMFRSRRGGRVSVLTQSTLLISPTLEISI